MMIFFLFSVVLLREVLQLSWDLGGSKFFRFFIPAEEKGGRHAAAPVYYSGHHNYYLGVFLEQVCILCYLNFVKVCVNYGASCNLVEVLQLKVPWDPGGSTRHRLEVKPKFKKGGMLATSPPATTGLGLGFLHWAWAARKTEAASINIDGMVTNKGLGTGWLWPPLLSVFLFLLSSSSFLRNGSNSPNPCHVIRIGDNISLCTSVVNKSTPYLLLNGRSICIKII
jgi:hypothetical protein